MQTWQNYSAPSLFQASNPSLRFPVQHTHAELQCSQGLTRLQVTQLFHNPNDSPVECCYVLKTISEAVLSSVRAKLGEEVIKFQVKEKEAAKEDYSDAVSSGKTAVLASREEDSITLQLGMVPGQSDIEITLKLIYALEYRLDRWRCIVSNAFFPLLPKSKQKIKGNALNLDMKIAEIDPILAVSSPTHNIITSITGTNAVVQLAPEEHDIDLDLILEYQTSTNSPYILRVERDEKLGESVATLGYRLSPASETQVCTGEYVFLLDRSGSMAGAKLEMLKEAMVFLLKSLPTECKFNIFSFGSSFEQLFPVSQPYSDQTTQQALSSIHQFKADLGGTQLLPALQQLLSPPPEDLYPRNIVLLTDGQVEDGSRVYELLRKHREKTRFHAIGLGQDVSEKWLQSVGVLTKGGFEVVKQAVDLVAALVAFLERALVPSVSGIEVIWPGQEWIPAPSAVRNVYEGDMVFVYANYGDREVAGNVLFRYMNTTSKRKEEVSLPLPASIKGKSLGKMWAFQRLSDLESVSEAMAVSLKYQIPSPHTAFIGVSAQAIAATLPMQSIDFSCGTRGSRRGRCSAIPVEMRTKSISRIARSRSPPIAKSISPIARSRSRTPVYARDQDLMDSPLVTQSLPAAESPESSNLGKSQSTGSLLWFIYAQSTAGYWPMSSVRDGLKAVSIPGELLQFGQQAEDIWATLMVVFLLSTRFASDSLKTSLLLRKAKAWLASLRVRYEDFLPTLQATA